VFCGKRSSVVAVKKLFLLLNHESSTHYSHCWIPSNEHLNKKKSSSIIQQESRTITSKARFGAMMSQINSCDSLKLKEFLDLNGDDLFTQREGFIEFYYSDFKVWTELNLTSLTRLNILNCRVDGNFLNIRFEISHCSSSRRAHYNLIIRKAQGEELAGNKDYNTPV